MPQATSISWGSLLGLDVLTTAATPLMGYCNVYNATSGSLSPTLRQAALGVLGTTCLVEKDPNDFTNNAVTITCYPGDTFFDGSTTRTLTNPGDFLALTLLAPPGGVAQWKVFGSGNNTPGGIGGDFLVLDGGNASTDYTSALIIDGGSAGTDYTGLITFDGGSARSISVIGFYTAADGSLHYAGPVTDTLIAPA